MNFNDQSVAFLMIQEIDPQEDYGAVNKVSEEH